MSAVTVALVALFIVVPRLHRGYASAQAAVRAICHAARIIGEYASSDGLVHIGWQQRALPEGDGWVALVRSAGGYKVVECKAQGIAHG